MTESWQDDDFWADYWAGLSELQFQYSVRAESVDGALMTLGLGAASAAHAVRQALARLPFDPHVLLVSELAGPYARERPS